MSWLPVAPKELIVLEDITVTAEVVGAGNVARLARNLAALKIAYNMQYLIEPMVSRTDVDTDVNEILVEIVICAGMLR